MSTLSLGTIFFCLKKMPKEKKKEVLDCILKGIRIVDTRKEAYVHIWKNGFTDLEDAMQEFCAIDSACTCIVTNDLKDYRTSALEVLSPREFLDKYTVLSEKVSPPSNKGLNKCR